MKRKPRPHVVITTDCYRIVQRVHGSICIETINGWDAMNVRRWQSADGEKTAMEFRAIITDIGEAIEKRKRRNQARRKNR